jgi:dUTP pyrophosphatase
MNNKPIEKNVLKFVRTSSKASIPTKGSPLAAGYDLYSSVDTTIEPFGKAIVNTDLMVAIPQGCYGRIAPRSSLAAHHGINVAAGVIDQDYRGTLKIVLFNHAKFPFKISQGDRIAQLICEKIIYPQLVEVNSLETTERGEKGFGSSGR